MMTMTHKNAGNCMRARTILHESHETSADTNDDNTADVAMQMNMPNMMFLMLKTTCRNLRYVWTQDKWIPRPCDMKRNWDSMIENATYHSHTVFKFPSTSVSSLLFAIRMPSQPHDVVEHTANLTAAGVPAYRRGHGPCPCPGHTRPPHRPQPSEKAKAYQAAKRYPRGRR